MSDEDQNAVVEELTGVAEDAAIGAAAHVAGARCTTCVMLRGQLGWGAMRYVFGLLSELWLVAVLFFKDGNVKDGGLTLTWILLPVIGLFLVHCLEKSQLRVLTDQGCRGRCRQCVDYLPPVSKWRKLRAHRETHEAHTDRARIEELTGVYNRTMYNAAILEDVHVCFNKAPQLVFQLVPFFQAMSQFDGDLVGVTMTMTSWSRLICIVGCAYTCLAVLVDKLDSKLLDMDPDSQLATNLKKLTFQCFPSRAGFLMVYGMAAAVHWVLLVFVMLVHFLAVLTYLLVKRRCNMWPLTVLESAVHITQYVSWEGMEKESHVKRGALAVAAVAEWLVFFLGLLYVFFFTERSFIIIYSACLGTAMVLTAACAWLGFRA